jgi:hypothetical protein
VRGSLGLVIGLTVGTVVGAAGMYLVLRPPWADGGGETPLARNVVASKGSGSAKAPKPKPGWRPQGNPGQRRPAPRPGAGSEDEGPDEPEVAPLTDADRRLEWRGDDVSVAPQRLDMSSSAEVRPLDDGEINATLGAHGGPVRDCIVQGAKGTDLRATITIELVVDGTGRVSRSRVHAPHYLLERGLLACARRALSRMKFPATGAPTKVTFPAQLG